MALLLIRDHLTGRKINIKEKMLIVGVDVYAVESYTAFDTSTLKGYPPKVYYDKYDNYLGKIYDRNIIELDDIEDMLLDYQDYCFSNHDLDDLRDNLCRKRESFIKNLLKTD